MSFAHLHVHSEFSLLEAACRVSDLVKQTQNLGMPAVALTDNGNMFGAMTFYFACKDLGIQPILGLDAYLAPRGRLKKGEDQETLRTPNRRLVLLAQSHKGYQNLCQLSSIGYQQGFYYKPRIDDEVLQEYNEDLLCLTGSHRGDVALALSEHGPEKALERIRFLKNIFGDRLYLELNRTGLPQLDALNKFLIEASKIENVPLVACNDVHYLVPEDARAHDVLLCVGTNKMLQDPDRFRMGSEEFYLKSPDQMRRLFSDLPEACDRTMEVISRCKVQFKFKDAEGKPIYHLPSYPTQQGRSLVEEIAEIAKQGLEDRFLEAIKRGEKVPEERIPEYKKRLEFEISVIDKMGFCGYFLIVQDFIRWAKDRDIPVGPGRGSGAGSLVAYSLKITDLDPMNYGLIFERFLNPERISMPDFDVDFCQDRREEVINYVVEKYGVKSVSQIITFGVLKAKAAIRDVGRVMGLTFAEVDVIAKLIPEKLNIKLKEAIETEPRLRSLIDEDSKIATLLELAQRVEGISRHASVHAAGVIISNRPLVEYAPLYKVEGSQNVIQYDMKISEKIGLIKYDFLGLKTLTLIHDALKMVERNQNKKIAPNEISLKDAGIYDLMSRGDTAGIFQFEGEGMSDLIKRVRPTCFEDITAINALYRPGPMQMLDEYIARKHGKLKVTYLFGALEEILKETYGIIVYQEQVQLIAARIASYSLGEADMLRRAMGKKKPEEMAQQKNRFMQGARDNGFDQKKSDELFELMAKFAEYGFNKSHAAAYCVVAAQTAYLKAYYPVEFYAAMLSTEMADTDKIVKYVSDCRSHGIQVRAPHVNFSEFKFTAHGKVVFFGLGGIKGVGQAAVEAILEARSQKPDQKFADLEDFFQSIDLRRVNKKVVECLIKSGGLDDFGYHRAQLLSLYPILLDQAEGKRKEKEVGQGSLFDLAEAEPQGIEVPAVDPWQKSQQLAFEKDVLGFYLSDHPISAYQSVMRSLTHGNVADIREKDHKSKVVVGGFIEDLRELITKKATRMAFGKLGDLSAHIPVVIFPDAFAKYQDLLKAEEPLLVEGELDRDETNIQIKVEKLSLLSERLKASRKLTLKLNMSHLPILQDVQKITGSYPGSTRLELKVYLEDSKKWVVLEGNESTGIEVQTSLFDRLQSIFGNTENIDLI